MSENTVYAAFGKDGKIASAWMLIGEPDTGAAVLDWLNQGLVVCAVEAPVHAGISLVIPIPTSPDGQEGGRP